MTVILKETLEGLVSGDPQKEGNIEIFPLYRHDRETINMDYLTLEEALQKKLLIINEVDEGGDVNNISVTNESNAVIIIFDGEELVGAKQNRMVNADTVILPGDTVNIPVSCVEQGRWRYTNRTFDRAGVFGYSKLRKEKAKSVHMNLSIDMSFESDQGAIWNEISAKQKSMNKYSETSAIHDVYEDCEEKFTNILEKLSLLPKQSGVAVFINGTFSSLDLFDKPETLKKIWPRLVKSFAMEAADQSEGSKEKKVTLPAEDALKTILGKLQRTKAETYNAVGAGTDIRIKGEKIVGAGLILKDELIHLSIFADEDNGRRKDGFDENYDVNRMPDDPIY